MNRVIYLDDARSAGPSGAIGSAERPQGARQPLDPYAIAFITAVRDEIQYRTCLQYVDAVEIPSGYKVEKIAVLGGASMAECYQRAMEASVARYKIYLHADTHIVHRGLLFELLHLFQNYPRLGLVGVVGSIRIPPGGLWWENDPLHSYGRLWQNSRPGFPASIIWPGSRERLHFMQFRSFVGDYLPAAVVDGFFMATQYDIPWTRPFFGFDLYDHVQALEFIRAGLEVGVARQEAIWCVHRGPADEPSREQFKRRDIRLYQQAEALRQLYPAFVGLPARKLYGHDRRVRTILEDLNPPKSGRDRLGIIIVTLHGREALPRALRALLPQCEALQDIECRVAVVDNGALNGAAEAVRCEFPHVTVIAHESDAGPAYRLNLGLRYFGFPNYVLVMRAADELSPHALGRMVGYLREDMSTAGVVASLVDPDGTVQFQRTAILELVRRQLQRLHLMPLVETTCALVRGEVFFDVGLYDERIRVHHEDLDWSLRARRKGYRFVRLPEAKVINRHSMGSTQNRRTIVAEGFPDNLLLAHKHGGRRWATVLYGLQRLLAKWDEFRCRNDLEARRRIGEAMARMEALYHRFREENRLPRTIVAPWSSQISSDQNRN